MPRHFIAFILLALNVAQVVDVKAETWILPLAITDQNMSVKFQVDSTWHLVEGATSGLSGKIWLLDPADPLSVQSELHIPVRLMDTDSDSRDTRMREILLEPQFPDLVVKTDKNTGGCTPQLAASKNGCSGTLAGTITMHGLTRSIELPYTAMLKGDKFEIGGTASLDWSNFNVEDPSILIARLDKKVDIQYSCRIPRAE